MIESHPIGNQNSMKNVIILAILSLAICAQAQPRSAGTSTGGQRQGARMGGVQGAQRPADVGILGTIVRKNRDRFGNEFVVVNSLGLGDQTYNVTRETKIMKNGYASNWEYIAPGDNAGGILKETGPFLKTLTLTSKPATVVPVKSTAAAGVAGDAKDVKPAVDPKAATAKKLFAWHQDQHFRGKAEGTRELGLDYVHGRGVETNLSKGMDLINEAASKGDEDAKVVLKKMASKD
jgi:hypothetical protein